VTRPARRKPRETLAHTDIHALPPLTTNQYRGGRTHGRLNTRARAPVKYIPCPYKTI